MQAPINPAEPASLHTQLRAAAQQHADRPAVAVDGRTISFAELYADADRVARALHQRLGADRRPVACLVTTGYHLPLGLLAVAKTGRPCTLLDARDPEPRLSRILADLQPAVILTDGGGAATAERLSDGRTVMEFDDLADPGGAPLWVEPDPNDPYMVIYTSGSTGAPKGVMRTFAGGAGTLTRGADPGLAPGRQVGLLWAAAAGMTASQLMRPLAVGATLCLYDVRACGPGPLAEWLRANRIVSVGFVPTIFRRMLDSTPPNLVFEDLRSVRFGGEALYWQDVVRTRRHLPEGAVIHNILAMAECSLVSRYEVPPDHPSDDGQVPVGRPLPGRSVRIVGPDGREVPTGSVGRLVVTGPQVAPGYWNDPALTGETFSSTPDGLRTAVTADLARVDQDGLLHMAGRADDMIKVAGTRVDPSEVENALRAQTGIRDAAVVPLATGDGQTRLAAFVLPANDAVEPSAVRRALARILPAPMVPGRIEIVDSLPLLPSGKTDRRALATVITELPRSAVKADPPRDELEGALCEVWREALGEPDLGIHDDFFELGGTSLQAAGMFARVERQLDLDLDLSLLLEAPTVAMMAAAVREGARDAPTPVVVELATGGTGTPLFCVHAAYGTVLLYRDLAEHLGVDRPVFGVQSPHLAGRPVIAPDMEALGAHYVRELRRHRPTGPYALLGHSWGGVVAFEMAQQLTRAGEAVTFLAIADIPCPADRRRRRLTLERWERYLRINRARAQGGGLRLLVRTGGGQLWWRTIQRLEGIRARWHVRRSGLVPRPLRPAWLWALHTTAMRGYEVRPYPGRVTVLLSQDRTSDPTHGWAPYAQNGVDVVRLKGWHGMIWHQPHLPGNAALLREALHDAG